MDRTILLHLQPNSEQALLLQRTLQEMEGSLLLPLGDGLVIEQISWEKRQVYRFSCPLSSLLWCIRIHA